MQAADDRAFQLSQKDFTPQYVPQGLNDLSSAVLSKVGSKYGLTPGQGFDTNMKNHYQPPPSIQPGQLNGQGMPPPSTGPMGQASSMPMQGGGMPGMGMPPPQSGAGGGMNPQMMQMMSQLMGPRPPQAGIAPTGPQAGIAPIPQQVI